MMFFARIKLYSPALLLLLLLSILLPTLADAANIQSVRLWRAPDNTRLVFDLSGPAEHKLMNLPGEKGLAQRIVITLPDSQFNMDASKVNIANTPLSSFLVEKNGKELQLVIDLTSRVKPKSFLLPANNQYGDRLVLDLFDEDSVRETKIVKPASNGMRDVIIAIDPGHGGEDPGAKGPGGIYEKNVTLAIAKELVKLINDTPGYSAFLTRSSDYYVSLRGRTQIARNKGADLFVSIHADAFKDSSAQGAGVFALSQRGATSETARWLAQTENDADLIGGVNLGDKDPVLQGVLLDLSMTATVATSLDMGDKVMAQMKKFTRMHRGFVEQAGFVVLKNPDIPSLLIETGFITNPEEARNLSSPKYRSTMAKGIFAGIDSHFRSKPPMDTALAAARGGKVTVSMDKVTRKPDQEPVISHEAAIDKSDDLDEKDDLEKLVSEQSAKKEKSFQKEQSVKKNLQPQPVAKPIAKKAASEQTVKHVVKKGETLSGIASRYKISMVALRTYNKMDDQQVRIGQTLKIPATSN
jgi:N-acetylmuramoyl-L-alanine amidase